MTQAEAMVYAAAFAVIERGREMRAYRAVCALRGRGVASLAKDRKIEADSMLAEFRAFGQETKP